MKYLSKLKKEDLVRILNKMLKEQPQYNSLVEDVKNKKQDAKVVTKIIEKEMANHNGSVLKAYQAYEHYKMDARESKSLMQIAFTFAEYLFEEIETYGGEIPDDLLDITLEVFEDACRLGVHYHEQAKMSLLYASLNSSIYEDDLIEAFYDVVSCSGAYDLLEEEI